MRVKSGCHCALSILPAGERRQRDSRNTSTAAFSLEATNLFKQRVAVLTGHADVCDDDVGLFALVLNARLRRGIDGSDPAPELREQPLGGFPRKRFILHQ